MLMQSSLFLDQDELRTLSGRCNKAQQIEALRQMGVPFYVNATGRPIVVRCLLQGQTVPTEKLTKWTPRLVVRHG